MLNINFIRCITATIRERIISFKKQRLSHNLISGNQNKARILLLSLEAMEMDGFKQPFTMVVIGSRSKTLHRWAFLS